MLGCTRTIALICLLTLVSLVSAPLARAQAPAPDTLAAAKDLVVTMQLDEQFGRAPVGDPGQGIARREDFQQPIGVLQLGAAIRVAQRHQERLLGQDRLGLSRRGRGKDAHGIEGRGSDRFLITDRGIEDLESEEVRDSRDHQGPVTSRS